MKKTIKLKTIRVINILKLLLIFPVLVVLGIVAKIVSFYYLELVILGFVFLAILWFYRITYIGKLKFDSGDCVIRVRFNIFNFKFVKIKVIHNGEDYKYTTHTKEQTLVIAKPIVPMRIELNMDLKANKEPEALIHVE